MQGFVDLTGDIALGFATLVPLLCYLLGSGFVISSGLGFWRLAHRQNQLQQRPWVPFVSMLMAGTLLSYDRILTFANYSLGFTATAVSVGPLTSYTAPTINPGGFVGGTPQDTLLAIVTAFDFFFKSYGALLALFGLLALKRISEGNSRRSTAGALVQIVFAILVMNVDQVAAGVIAYF